jgi:hypothetical protein
MANKLKHPCTVIVAGPTASGKTVLVVEILLHNRFTFNRLRENGKPNSHRPEHVVWVYGQPQNLIETMKEIARFDKKLMPSIEFISKYDNSIIKSFDKDENNVLVLDDQMEELKDDPQLSKLFTQVSHHKNVTVIMLLQNLFEQGKEMRTVRSNAHYIITMRNPRDQGIMRSMLMQMSPLGWRWMLNAYEDATRNGYAHCMIDMRSPTPDSNRIVSSVTSPNPAFYTSENFEPKEGEYINVETDDDDDNSDHDDAQPIKPISRNDS